MVEAMKDDMGQGNRSECTQLDPEGCIVTTYVEWNYVRVFDKRDAIGGMHLRWMPLGPLQTFLLKFTANFNVLW
jgi:hypothetical protein